ncbi:CLUMA_CG010266, isoform A [Clunio marinus]|uniref:CLUMA_CG010266, isoform A n=1 Tax=Clunio marinus TaxID=568069 RepID=A0A1J1I8N8_9DIPT|nr:CLUMA_CG010266, isoform A [Clunio marinus]
MFRYFGKSLSSFEEENASSTPSKTLQVAQISHQNERQCYRQNVATEPQTKKICQNKPNYIETIAC